MSLISEQVARLTLLAVTFEHDDKNIIAKEIRDAVTTIEHLSEKLHAANMERSSAYYNGGWIPCEERLPEDLEAVNITWINHKPEPYYHNLKNKNFVATGVYYRGDWYWYSTTCADYLGEYGSNEIDKVDDAIEVVAWKPLPKPYKEDENEETTENDLISRADAIEAIASADLTDGTEPVFCGRQVIELLKQLPKHQPFS